MSKNVQRDLMKTRSEELKKEKEERDKNIIKLRNQGLEIKQIMERLNTSQSTVARILRRNREK